MRKLKNCSYTKDPIYLDDVLVLCDNEVYSYGGLATDTQIGYYADHVRRYPEMYKEHNIRYQYSFKDIEFLKKKIPEWSKVFNKIIKGE